MAREKFGLLAVPRTAPVKPTGSPCIAHVRPWQWNAFATRTVNYL